MRVDQEHSYRKTATAFREKALWSIVLTAVILAISIVFMQTRILQVQSELTDLNTELEAKRRN